MSLAIRGTVGLSNEEVKSVRRGTWIEERLHANTFQGKRTEELLFGRPRRVVKILFKGETRRGKRYANVMVKFGGSLAAITLKTGDVRFRIAKVAPDFFDLIRFSKRAENSSEIVDL